MLPKREAVETIRGETPKSCPESSFPSVLPFLREPKKLVFYVVHVPLSRCFISIVYKIWLVCRSGSSGIFPRNDGALSTHRTRLRDWSGSELKELPFYPFPVTKGAPNPHFEDTQLQSLVGRSRGWVPSTRRLHYCWWHTKSLRILYSRRKIFRPGPTTHPQGTVSPRHRES